MNSVEGLAQLSREMVHQASLISYLNAFGLYSLVSAAAIPLILFISRPAKKAP